MDSAPPGDVVKRAAEQLVRDHVAAINCGDEAQVRRQLVAPRSPKASISEVPLQKYIADMLALRPIELVSVRATSEPVARTTQSGPIKAVWVEFELRIRGQLLKEELPCWWVLETGEMLFASRIPWRPGYFVP